MEGHLGWVTSRNCSTLEFSLRLSPVDVNFYIPFPLQVEFKATVMDHLVLLGRACRITRAECGRARRENRGSHNSQWFTQDMWSCVITGQLSPETILKCIMLWWAILQSFYWNNLYLDATLPLKHVNSLTWVQVKSLLCLCLVLLATKGGITPFWSQA